ncbi:hypothetical protein BJ878DRAFT_145364 [Calycina marina]|uniref:Uncharacterized protein n=1 Tax=Calycina marina TaxID=1763456 RepID=A0A9P7Z081_9HELO|nr:hypothetical protein BJ878DRAFT_145364 [Calycina marina]
MAFLFKSKKNAEKAQAAKDGGVGSAASQQMANGASRGWIGGSEKGGPVQQSSTPTGSVNNSMNSLQGAGNTSTPSPDQLNGARRRPSVDQQQDIRNGAVQSQTSNPNASLYPWSQRRMTYTTAHPSPFPRYGAAVNSVASKEGDIYLMGGLINSSMVKGDLWMVEAGGNMACYPLATTAEGPGPRVGHTSLLVGNAFIVYGGDTKMDDSDVLDETLYLLNTSTRQWSRAVPAGPRPSGRYGHSLNILGSKIYVFGGQVEGYFMNDLVAFDLNQLQVPTNKWEFLIRNTDEGGPAIGEVPPARTNHSVVTFNEKLYLFGGTDGVQWFNDVWCYDPMTNSWESLGCIGYIPAPREGHAAAIVDDVMYIFGGRTEEGADLGDLAAFRITSRRWYTFQNMGPSPSPRSGHSMTAYEKQIVVLAGEPSTATREVADLSIVYLLDTSKIRYPADDAAQSSQTVDRVPGQRPSGGEKAGMGATRGPPVSLQGQDQKRINGPPVRESVPAQGLYGRGYGQLGMNGNDSNGIAPGSAQPQGAPPGSRLLGGSTSQSPPGPPPQQAAPAPRSNALTQASDERWQTQGSAERSSRPSINTNVTKRALENVSGSSQARNMSPAPKESSPLTREREWEQNVLANGRRTPTSQGQQQQTSKAAASPEVPPHQTSMSTGAPRENSRTRAMRQQGSIDSTTESPLRIITNRAISPPPPTRQNSNPLARKGSARNSQTVSLLKELDTAKSRNAWYASELELARKSGYGPNPSSIPMLDQRAAESFDDEDKPLIEALLAMKAELSNVQGSIDKQAILAAKKIAEVEKQRDSAVREAVYAKAKLAAHGGSQNGTPQPDSDARDLGTMSSDRSTDISRRLAAVLATQQDLTNQINMLHSELETEKRARKLAEDTSEAAHTRIQDLERYKHINSSEVERLKAELHEAQIKSRDEAVICSEAVATAKLIQADRDELESRLQETMDSTKEQGDTFESLRTAISSSADMRSILERKLEEERTQREKVENKLFKLKAEHETRSAELDTATRRLRDAEELAEQHANEARTHRQMVLAGLDRISTRDVGSKTAVQDGRVNALQDQVKSANALVKNYQTVANTAAEKLRAAEERIAGLEAYQEQASREGMSIRKQLQTTMREVQTLQASNSDMKYQISNQQLETNAVNVQHNTMKDILGERGISPSSASRTRGMGSPRSGGSMTPDPALLRELEQQLVASQQAHNETKSIYERREQEAESTYREKLSQLENDYQSAVHYVKGTEKMLKRMKDELAKYKTDNSRLKEQVEAEDKSAANRSSLSTWEAERSDLNAQIENLQASLKNSVAQLEQQLAQVRKELESAHQERDLLKENHESAQRQLTTSTTQAQENFAQLQNENQLLERRAEDAEHKVTMLLDQMVNSVDNARRQSQRVEVPSAIAGGAGHQRNISGAESMSETSLYGDSGGNRNSMALDSLANELETLRTHWETTNKNYRLSNAFDFEECGPERSPLGVIEGAKGSELSSSLADWRKRLDQEEVAKGSRMGGEVGLVSLGAGMNLGSPSGTGKREMSPSGKDVAAGGSQINVL